LADLKACKQSNIPVYSFAGHQRLEEKKYLYGATIIISSYVSWLVASRLNEIVIAEGIMALQDPTLRALYDLKVSACGGLLHVLIVKLRCLFNVIRILCLLDDSKEMSKNAQEM
jgi:hypothetical protein